MLMHILLASLALVPVLAGAAFAGAGGTFAPDVAVPEPASLALLAGGAAALLAVRRRRK